MADLTAKTRFLPPLYDSRAASPGLSPRRGAHRRLHSVSEDAPYDISPVAILQAFSDSVLPREDAEEYKWLACANGATSAQKGLVIKAAKVALGARDWYLELKRWNWPGSFQAPSADGSREQVEYRDHEGVMQTIPLEYWGCLPAAMVETYEARIEEIQDEMVGLNIDELKGYVLDIHGSRSRPSSSYEKRARASAASLNLMDDISLLVTGTMVQALPVLTLLNQLLDTWAVRLTLLRESPAYLADLAEANKALELAWDAIQLPEDDEIYPSAVKKWKAAADTIQDVLERKTSSLAQRLDSMLDALEGREDILPDIWIDDFESLESDIGRWTRESRHKRMQLDVMWASNPQPDPEPVEPPKTAKAKPTFPPPKTVPSDVEEPESPLFTPRAESFPSPPTAFSPRSAQHSVPKISGRDLASIGLAAPFVPRVPDHEYIGPKDEVEDHDISVEDEESKADRLQHTPRARMSINASPDSRWKRSGLIFSDESFGDYQDSNGIASDILNSQGRPPIIKRASTASIEAFTRDQVHAEVIRPAMLKRASTTSIESFSRDQLKAVTLSRSNSGSSIASGLSSRRKRMSSVDPLPLGSRNNSDASEIQVQKRASVQLPIKEEDLSPTPMDTNFGNVPITPTIPGRSTTPQSSPRSVTPTRSPESSFGDDSPSVRPTRLNPLRAHPPLNVSVKKLRQPDRTNENISVSPATPPSFILSEGDNGSNVHYSNSPKKSRHQRTHSSTSNAELNKQISAILTTVPANIRLTNTESDSSHSQSSSTTAPNKSPSSKSTSHRFSAFSAFRSSRSSVRTPEMTLSPVKNEDQPYLRKQASAEHSDIKLYHLIQPGRDKPIKLFIRRVGENGERVMVRVGGGWADLGEYLRQYAEHHGHRTVSDGKFEMLGASIDGLTGVTSSSPSSRGPSRSASPLPSAMGGTPVVSDAQMQAMAGTPTSASATAHLRLASGSNVNTPDSIASNTSKGSQKDIGLAGPATKKLDLSDEKLEWIDNMMSQARRISGSMKDGKDLGRGEKARDSQGGGVQDMGRVGGTRRVFLRGSGRDSATGERRDG